MRTGYAQSFRDLRVYQKSREVSRMVFRLSKAFPKEEMYSLTDQMHRAARSVGAQIAEAWGKRRYERHFVSKLTDADAEQMETQHWVSEAMDCGYISLDDAVALNAVFHDAKRRHFLRSPDGVVREDAAEYFTDHSSLITEH